MPQQTNLPPQQIEETDQSSKTLQQICSHVAANYPHRAEHEFYLVSDGSGHTDGFCGSACLIFAPGAEFFDIRCSASTGSSVDRAEFEALLLGLQAIVDFVSSQEKLGVENLRARRPLVHWTTDRANLVGSVAIDPAIQAPFWRRRNCPDLWARFAYYENLFRITPFYLERNSIQLHKIADNTSADMRQLIKDYASGWAGSMEWMTGWEHGWRDPDKLKAFVDEYIAKLQALSGDAALWEDYVSTMVSTHGSAYWSVVTSMAFTKITGGELIRNLKGQYLPLN